VNVAVVGLGKIGLPLAVQYASKGMTVVGCDIDAARVEAINRADCPIPNEEGLAEGMAAAIAAGRLRATTATAEAVAGAAVVVVVVQVNLDHARQPDYSALDAAAAAVGRGLSPGALVILESTVPVGTTRSRLGSMLAAASGLRAGEAFALAYSPERVFSGRIFRDLRTYPKIVGGIDAASTARAAAFYRTVLDAEVVTVADCETAEFTKLIETTYRDVNIALANEFARYADAAGIDVMQAIAAANSQPFSHIHQPGVGVGGHCIPVNPHLLMGGTEGLELVATGRRVNESMAEYGVAKLEAALGGLAGATVLVLGLSYRPDVREASHSSTVALAEALARRKARALVHDPFFSAAEIRALGLEPAMELPPAGGVEAIIVQAWHTAYQSLDFASFRGCKALLDGRNALERSAVESSGLRYLGIGR